MYLSISTILGAPSIVEILKYINFILTDSQFQLVKIQHVLLL